MDEERVFSLSYEQLTRFAEKRIRECNLDSQGAIYLCESAKAGAVLIFWHELAINGYASMNAIKGTVAKLAMRQPFVLFKGLTFQKLCLPGAFRPGDHHNKMLRPGLCVVHASPQYL